MPSKFWYIRNVRDMLFSLLSTPPKGHWQHWSICSQSIPYVWVEIHFWYFGYHVKCSLENMTHCKYRYVNQWPMCLWPVSRRTLLYFKSIYSTSLVCVFSSGLGKHNFTEGALSVRVCPVTKMRDGRHVWPSWISAYVSTSALLSDNDIDIMILFCVG